MTDAYTWPLSEIRTRWREETGLSQTTDISDANVNKLINDYYVNHFPQDIDADEFNIFITQALSATDDGEYSISIDIDRLDEPLTLDGDAILLMRDRERFFNTYPEDEQYITAPGLAIGVSDTTKVLHSAFDYRISGYAYSKATSEITLTGTTVSQNKYGAFSFKINSAGTISVEQANSVSSSTVIGSDLNEYSCILAHTSSTSTRPITGGSYSTYWVATGGTGSSETWVTGTSYQAASVDFNSPRLALRELSQAASASCYMGYVVVVSTAAGGFVPGTTALDDSAVTDTYTDGRFELRNKPEAVLLYGTKMYVRPKPDDIYQIRVLSIGDRPAALTGDTDLPSDALWGPAIARGAAVLYLESHGEAERVASMEKSTKYLFSSIRSKRTDRLMGMEIQRRY